MKLKTNILNATKKPRTITVYHVHRFLVNTKTFNKCSFEIGIFNIEYFEMNAKSSNLNLYNFQNL